MKGGATKSSNSEGYEEKNDPQPLKKTKFIPFSNLVLDYFIQLRLPDSIRV